MVESVKMVWTVCIHFSVQYLSVSSGQVKHKVTKGGFDNGYVNKMTKKKKKSLNIKMMKRKTEVHLVTVM